MPKLKSKPRKRVSKTDGSVLILVQRPFLPRLKLLKDPRPSSGTVHKVSLNCQLSPKDPLLCSTKSLQPLPMVPPQLPVVEILLLFSKKLKDLLRSSLTSVPEVVLLSNLSKESNCQESLLFPIKNEEQVTFPIKNYISRLRIIILN